MIVSFRQRRRTYMFMLLASSAFGLAIPPSSGAAPPPQPEVIHQLRIYEIFEDNKRAFHERFRDHAARIMARHEFKILAMWETSSEGRTEFVYLLEWPDAQTMKARWAGFMADPEWSRIKRETGAVHGALVGEIEDRTLVLTDYSPAPARAGMAERRLTVQRRFSGR